MSASASADGTQSRVNLSRQTLWAVVAGDIFALFLALLVVLTTVFLGGGWLSGSSATAAVYAETVGLLIVWIASLIINESYEWHVRADARRGAVLLFRSTAYAVAVTVLARVTLNWQLPVAHVAVTALVGLGCLVIGRIISAKFVRELRVKEPLRIMFVGTAKDVAAVLGGDSAARFPFHQPVAALLTDPENKDCLEAYDGLVFQPLSGYASVAEAVQRHGVDVVWVTTVTEFGDKALRRMTWDLHNIEARLYLEPMIGGIAANRIKHQRVGTRSTLYVARPRFVIANGWFKRTCDVVISLLTLNLISPIFLIVAVAIKLEDRGPVFYKSQRIGINGVPFNMWKFRSMYLDADAKIEQLAKETGQSLLRFKMKDDPRVTSVGKFIRKTSIDELPQFINSLNGTMSIVGPRPQTQREVDLYSEDMLMRLSVRPGITGLWQVNGRSDLNPEQSENLDLFYIDNWSVGLDITTFFRTFTAVLASKGAY